MHIHISRWQNGSYSICLALYDGWLENARVSQRGRRSAVAVCVDSVPSLCSVFLISVLSISMNDCIGCPSDSLSSPSVGSVSDYKQMKPYRVAVSYIYLMRKAYNHLPYSCCTMVSKRQRPPLSAMSRAIHFELSSTKSAFPST